jgi:hypothetical protein
LKRCSECAREIEDSQTICNACAEWAAALIAAPVDGVTPARQQDASADAESGASRAGSSVGRRELLLGVVAVSGGALITFALLFARGVPSSEVSAAAPAAAARQPSSPAPSPSVIVQKWTTENRAYWLGNQRHGAAFELPADNLVQTSFGPVRPSLVVRCVARTTETFVYTGSPMKIEPNVDGKTVTVSLDNEPVRTEQWPDADDHHDALFAPDGAAFAQRLLQAQTLRFGYTPHNSNEAVAQFHVSGLGELIDPVAKECGWTK